MPLLAPWETEKLMKKPKPKSQGGSLIPAAHLSGMLSDPKKNMVGLVKMAFEGLTENTLRAYSKAWDGFAQYLQLPDRAAAASELCKRSHGEANGLALGYRTDMIARKLAPSTVNIRLAALKSITDRLRIMGVITWSLEVKGLRVETYKDTRGPGEEAILKVIKDLQAKTDRKSIRDCAIITTIYTMGLRRAELGSLEPAHIEWKKRALLILGKGKHQRVPLTLPKPAFLALERWFEVRPKEAKGVFVGLGGPDGNGMLTGYSIWRIVKGYGLGRPHGLRHSAITEALEKYDPRTVMRFSRHADLKTLMLYDDNRQDSAGEIAESLGSGLGEAPKSKPERRKR